MDDFPGNLHDGSDPYSVPAINIIARLLSEGAYRLRWPAGDWVYEDPRLADTQEIPVIRDDML